MFQTRPYTAVKLTANLLKLGRRYSLTENVRAYLACLIEYILHTLCMFHMNFLQNINYIFSHIYLICFAYILLNLSK